MEEERGAFHPESARERAAREQYLGELARAFVAELEENAPALRAYVEACGPAPRALVELHRRGERYTKERHEAIREELRAAGFDPDEPHLVVKLEASFARLPEKEKAALRANVPTMFRRQAKMTEEALEPAISIPVYFLEPKEH